MVGERSERGEISLPAVPTSPSAAACAGGDGKHDLTPAARRTKTRPSAASRSGLRVVDQAVHRDHMVEPAQTFGPAYRRKRTSHCRPKPLGKRVSARISTSLGEDINRPPTSAPRCGKFRGLPPRCRSPHPAKARATAQVVGQLCDQHHRAHRVAGPRATVWRTRLTGASDVRTLPHRAWPCHRSSWQTRRRVAS